MRHISRKPEANFKGCKIKHGHIKSHETHQIENHVGSNNAKAETGQGRISDSGLGAVAQKETVCSYKIDCRWHRFSGQIFFKCWANILGRYALVACPNILCVRNTDLSTHSRP